MVNKPEGVGVGGPTKEGVLSVRANKKRQLRTGVIQGYARSGFPPPPQKNKFFLKIKKYLVLIIRGYLCNPIQFSFLTEKRFKGGTEKDRKTRALPE